MKKKEEKPSKHNKKSKIKLDLNGISLNGILKESKKEIKLKKDESLEEELEEFEEEKEVRDFNRFLNSSSRRSPTLNQVAISPTQFGGIVTNPRPNIEEESEQDLYATSSNINGKEYISTVKASSSKADYEPSQISSPRTESRRAEFADPFSGRAQLSKDDGVPRMIEGGFVQEKRR